VAGIQEPSPSRKVRADAERNRGLLLATAKAAFADKGSGASMDEIARTAGVGAGTLYRHFPNRDALIEAVYLNETQQLAQAATELAASFSPVEALRAWMRLFVDYIATKKVLASALSAMVGGSTELYATSWARISGAMSLLVERARAAGDIRPDADPADLLRALAGFTYGAASPDWQASALRLIDILMDGLKPVREDRPFRQG